MPKTDLRKNRRGSIQHSAIPRELLEAAMTQVHNYTVGFVANDEVAGSGTLATVGNTFGIVTADHVWQHLRKAKDGHVSMVIDTREHNFRIPLEHLQPTIIGHYAKEHEENGPDLAFLTIVSEENLDDLRAKKSFAPIIPKHLNQFKQMPYRQMQWLVVGASAELSESTGSREMEDFVLRCTYFVGECSCNNKVVRDGFDYLECPSSQVSTDSPKNTEV